MFWHTDHQLEVLGGIHELHGTYPVTDLTSKILPGLKVRIRKETSLVHHISQILVDWCPKKHDRNVIGG